MSYPRLPVPNRKAESLSPLPDEEIVEQHRRQDADERLVVGETRNAPGAAFLGQPCHRRGIEIAGGADALGTHQFRDEIEGLAFEEKALVIRSPVRLFRAVDDVRW